MLPSNRKSNQQELEAEGATLIRAARAVVPPEYAVRRARDESARLANDAALRRSAFEEFNYNALAHLLTGVLGHKDPVKQESIWRIW